ncbi:hypothetical protein [uncultured Campylobacter sp.]|uniref:hypothetical protein n=1 Tax=uncultured Campylobacter sp. TaxID=218934 RepID=UPI00260E09A8|nr:hypothetical protein [uncultured Campylobacter sp.]
MIGFGQLLIIGKTIKIVWDWLEKQERLERRRKRNAAIIRCLIYSAIIGVLYYYGFTDSFFEWIYNWWNG